MSGLLVDTQAAPVGSGTDSNHVNLRFLKSSNLLILQAAEVAKSFKSRVYVISSIQRSRPPIRRATLALQIVG